MILSWIYGAGAPSQHTGLFHHPRAKNALHSVLQRTSTHRKMGDRALPGQVGYVHGEGGGGMGEREKGRTLVEAFQICSRMSSSHRI